MSFFDSVKKSLGMSKDKQSSTSPNVKFTRFDITFTAETLGIGISKYSGIMPHLPPPPVGDDAEKTCPIVTSSDVKSFDVQPGDLIVALEGNPISSFEDFSTIVKAIGRPVRISFMRKVQDGANQVNSVSSNKPGNSTTATVAPNSGGAGSLSSLNPMGIFRGMGSSNNKPTSTASIVVLTEEEKQLRRERLSAAAQDRSKTWDKKLGQKKKSSGSAAEITDANASSFSNAGGENTNAETERAIRKTKELEEKIEKQLGYSPFRPHMSFASGAASAAGAGAGAGSTATPGEADQELGRVAVVTVSKMIQNIHNCPEDVKLRSIRVSNKAFQSKVAGVPGGAELLVAAGYEYRAIPEQGQEQEQEELYLVHSMDAEGRVRLRYTLGRIQELLESVGGGAASPTSPSPRQPSGLK